MFSRVLAPLDGSPAATERLRDIGALCKYFDAELVLLMVIDDRQREAMLFDLPTGPVTARGEVIDPADINRRSQIYLDRAMVILSRAGIEVRSEQMEGTVDVAILRAASEHECDLIAVSPSTHQTSRRIFIGSTTERLLHSSPIPVFVVNEGSGAPFSSAGKKKADGGTVLVPLDGSRDAEAPLAFASTLAGNIGARLRLASIAPPSLEPGEAGHLELSNTLADIKHYLGRLVLQAASQGGQADFDVAVGDPAAEFIRMANRLDNPTVVMSTRRRSAASRRLVGSFADRVAQKLTHPLFIVPRDS
ncbi:MAG: universal stress protein [Chloroflexi bacterium]|nr:universal stress protein [Chloroflexota bacterium]